MWFLDSGCLRHMTGDISLFTNFTQKNKGFVTYGDNNKGIILCKCSVGNPSSTTISDVILVEGFKQSLLSIIQLCDKDYKITFTNSCCIIEHNEKKDYLVKGLRVNNIYMLTLNDVSLTSTKCLVTMSEDSWLWHKLLAHVNFDKQSGFKRSSYQLPKIKFSKTTYVMHAKWENK
jgi:hypothetical protein